MDGAVLRSSALAAQRIPINTVLALPRRVAVLLRPKHLAQVVCVSPVPVSNEAKAGIGPTPTLAQPDTGVGPER